MTTKDRIITLLQLLQTQSDEEHPLTTFDIIAYFKNMGVVVDRSTVKEDIDALINRGIEIAVEPGRPNKYFYDDRLFELPELKLLVDAVEASKFITARKSEELVRKLTSMTGTGNADELNRHLYTAGRVKAENEHIFYVVDTLFRAINQGKKISFQYFRYNLERTRVPRHGGEEFVISPYAMLYNEDRYYVIGHYEYRKAINIFRVDRMGIPEILDQEIEPKPSDFDPVDYTVDVFSMYGGKKETVKLLCSKSMMDQVVDHFGDEFETKVVDEDHFMAKVEVSVSQTFFAWVFQYAGEIQIVGPKKIKEQYATMLKSAICENAEEE